MFLGASASAGAFSHCGINPLYEKCGPVERASGAPFATILTTDQARRVASDIAKLPTLLPRK